MLYESEPLRVATRRVDGRDMEDLNTSGSTLYESRRRHAPRRVETDESMSQLDALRVETLRHVHASKHCSPAHYDARTLAGTAQAQPDALVIGTSRE